METTPPDPSQYPHLYAVHAVLTDSQWGDLFANRLAKRSAAQLVLKHHALGAPASRRQPTQGDLNRLTDAIAQEMHAYRPIKARQPGAGLLI